MTKTSIWLSVLITTTLVFMTGCGKIQDKVSEKVSEGIVEEAVGGKVDITKDGISVQKDGASFKSGDDLKWPKSAMGDLPEPKAKINGVMDASNKEGCTVVFSEMNLNNAKAYVENLKELGYKDNGLAISDEDGLTYAGQNSAKASILFSYKISAKDGMIGYTSATPSDSNKTN